MESGICSECGKFTKIFGEKAWCVECIRESRKGNKFFDLFENIPYSNDRVGKGFIRPASKNPIFKSTSEDKSSPEKSNKDKLYDNPIWQFIVIFTICSIIFLYGFWEADSFERNSFRNVVLVSFGISIHFALYMAFRTFMSSDKVKNVVSKIYRRIIIIVVVFALIFSCSLLPTLY